MSYTEETAREVISDYNLFAYQTKDLCELDENFIRHKFGFEDHTWLKHKGSNALAFATSVECGFGWGWNFKGDWVNHQSGDKSFWSFGEEPGDWELASKEEVLDRVERYKQVIGLVTGAKVFCLARNRAFTLTNKPHIHSGFTMNQMWMVDTQGYGVCIFNEGSWAPVITDSIEQVEALVQKLRKGGIDLTYNIKRI
jgi:hypothetical protein